MRNTHRAPSPAVRLENIEGLEWKNLAVVGLIIIGLSSIPGCLISSDKGWFTPDLYADFTSIDLSSLSDTLDKHNISYYYDIDEEAIHFYESINLSITGNTTYFFSDNWYNISAPTRIGLHNDSDASGLIWMVIILDANRYLEYRYPSEKEALDANYLLEPSFDLMKYFLNESSNPMPYKVRYGVY